MRWIPLAYALSEKLFRGELLWCDPSLLHAHAITWYRVGQPQRYFHGLLALCCYVQRPSVHRWDSCTHRVSDAVEKFDKNKKNALTSSIEQIVWTLNYVGIYIRGKWNQNLQSPAKQRGIGDFERPLASSLLFVEFGNVFFTSIIRWDIGCE